MTHTTNNSCPGPIRALVMALALALVAAGCGQLQSDDQEVSTDDPTGAATPAAPGSDDTDAASNDDGDTDSGETADDNADAAVEQSSTTATTAPPAITMPDLIGMSETNARSALSALGVEDVSLETRESFDPPGTVLDQVPSADRIISGSVTLVVAESIQPMPDFVGQPIADARKWAEERNVELRTEVDLTDDTPAGQIVAQIPSPGAEVSQEIVVTVADAPVTVDLADYGWLEKSNAFLGEIEMNGSIFPNTAYIALRSSSSSRKTGWISYNLSRDWSTLKMDLGLSDELSSSAIVQIEISADSELIYSDTIAFGALQSVELDVTGVLRLAVVATVVEGQETQIGLGNARLIGGAATGG